MNKPTNGNKYLELFLILFGLVKIKLHGLSMDIHDNPRTTRLLLVELGFFMCYISWSKMAKNEKVAKHGIQI